MSDSFKKRLPKKVQLHDLEVFEVLPGLTGYSPADPALTVASLTTRKNTVENKQTTEAQARAQLKAAIDDARDEEKAFHQLIQQAIDAVKVQFGVNSNEYQAVGRKKKSEYKTPKRKPGNNNPA